MKSGKDAAKPELALQIIIFFAVNPDEELSLNDALHKWSPAHRSSLWAAFRKLQRHGYISAQTSRKGFIVTSIYRAGPELLRFI